jgi:hypothetical protein
MDSGFVREGSSMDEKTPQWGIMSVRWLSAYGTILIGLFVFVLFSRAIQRDGGTFFITLPAAAANTKAS